jgi:hypothetical protein
MYNEKKEQWLNLALNPPTDIHPLYRSKSYLVHGSQSRHDVRPRHSKTAMVDTLKW